MRHSCKSDRQTLAETLPSFLGWRELRSLLLSGPFSPQALQNLGIKKDASTLFLFLPFPSRLLPQAIQQHGAFFRASSRLESNRVLSSTGFDRLHLAMETMHSTVLIPKMTGCVELEPCFTTRLLLFIIIFCINGLRHRLVQQGNARLVPHTMD